MQAAVQAAEKTVVQDLDHIVINTLTRIGAAADLFRALGFILTPLGRHSLGSLNHLMVCEGAYLELVGVPETGKQRADVLHSARGLNGLVLRSNDAEATHAQMAAAGLDPSDPVSFSRPVDIDGTETEARFRTVRLPETQFQAGRVYFCEHLTPDLIWRPDWLTHPNGFAGFERIVVSSTDPATDAARYAALCGSQAAANDGGLRVPLGGIDIDIVAGSAPAFATLGLRFASLDTLRDAAMSHPDAVWSDDGPACGTLNVPSLDLTLTCRGMG